MEGEKGWKKEGGTEEKVFDSHLGDLSPRYATNMVAEPVLLHVETGEPKKEEDDEENDDVDYDGKEHKDNSDDDYSKCYK